MYSMNSAAGMGIGGVGGGGGGGLGNHNNNNGLLINGNSSVPLYRRQALTGNGIGGGYNMPGMDTGANLIEALFQANNSVGMGDHSMKSQTSDHMHGLLYNNFNAMKGGGGGGHDVDLFQGMPPSVVPHSEAGGNHHHHQHQQSSGAPPRRPPPTRRC